LLASKILLHAQAPAKPASGSPCTGCGACCALEPCPLAHLFLLQFRGRCRALLWQDDASRYSCGMVAAPGRFLPWLPAILRPWASRRFIRRIAAGSGCDADIEVDD